MADVCTRALEYGRNNRMKKYDNINEMPAELLQLWETAWKLQPTKDNPFRIDLPSKKAAVNLRQLLYQVRKKMAEINYPGVQNFQKLEVVWLGEHDLGFAFPNWMTNVRKALQTGQEQLPPQEEPPHVDHEVLIQSLMSKE